MDLATLIETKRHEHSRSYEQVAQVASERGHKISGSAVHKYSRSGRLPGFPAPATLLALAAGLEVPIEQVVAAASESVGLPISPHTVGDERVQAWLALTEDRSPEEVEALLTAISTLLNTRRKDGDADR